jgi:threonine-phosphate decarboxylase
VSDSPSAVHGGQVYAYARQTGLPEAEALTQVLDFSASINPVAPVIDWSNLLQTTQQRLAHYPDQQAVKLKQALAARFDVDIACIALTHGITAAIHDFFCSQRPACVVLLTPLYGEYAKAAQRFAGEVIELPLQAVDSPSALLENPTLQSLPENSWVVLVNPSTPQGHFSRPQDWLPFLSHLKTQQAGLLVDEAFLPFVGLEAKYSFRPFLTEFNNLLIFQSLTKYYACPGARLGAVFAPLQLLPTCFDSAWPVSVFDQQYLLQALADPTLDARTQDWLHSAKRELIDALHTLAVVEKIDPSHANYLLVRFNRPVAEIQATLLPQGMLIRDCQSFGLDACHARIAVKLPTENTRLVDALRQLENLNAAE